MRILELTRRPYGSHVIIALRGELDLTSCDQLYERLRSAGSPHVLLDLQDLTFIDCSGISVLARCHQERRAEGGSITLVAPRPIVAKVLKITGIDRVLPVCAWLDDAPALPEQTLRR